MIDERGARPTALPRKGRGAFTIPVRRPYPWHAVLGYLSHRCTPGLETIEHDHYLRHTPAGVVSVTCDQAAGCLVAAPPDSARIPDVEERLRRLFDTGCDPDAVSHVLNACPLLRPRVESTPGLRVPGCWEPFELCVRAVLGQQVSVKAANTLMLRLVARCPSLRPAELAEANLDSLGITTRRAHTIRSLAEAVRDDRLRLEGQPWSDMARQLGDVPGFGTWTLAYLGIRLGREPDGFPESDLGLLRASRASSPLELRRLSAKWRPYRAYAAMYLWVGLSDAGKAVDS